MLDRELDKSDKEAEWATNAGNTHRGEAFDQPQTRILQKWLLDNIRDPYPRRKGLTNLAKKTGLSRRQVQFWMQNNRKRKLRPILQRIAEGKTGSCKNVYKLMLQEFEQDLMKMPKYDSKSFSEIRPKLFNDRKLMVTIPYRDATKRQRTDDHYTPVYGE